MLISKFKSQDWELLSYCLLWDFSLLLSGGDTSQSPTTTWRTNPRKQARPQRLLSKKKIIFFFPGKISLPDWDVESGKQKVAIPADIFLNHVANLHCEDNDGEEQCRVELSYWSRSLQILSSDWWTRTPYYAKQLMQ